ncbi:MAG: hypothetical protein HY851_01845, partial [candidate division Zixibacteria bacterium]|nr:hypothetical protein [candidate division Zixibacteria bacterium]
MPTNAADILNGLLGVAPLTGIGQGNQATGLGVTEGSPVFSDILGLLTNPSLVQNGEVNPLLNDDGRSGKDNGFEKSLINELGGQISSVWMLGRATVVAGQPFTKLSGDDQRAPVGIGAMPDFGADQLDPLPVVPEVPLTPQMAPFETFDPKMPTAKESDKVTSMLDTPAGPITAPVVLTSGAQRMPIAEAIDLTPGTYRVLAAEVTDRSLHLTLESSDQKHIQVTLPLDQLLSGTAAPSDNAKTPVTGAANTRRVAMGGALNPSRDITKWFDKLNLSEVHVEAMNVASGDAGAKSLKLSFVDPGAVRTQPFEAVLPNVEVRAFRIQNQSVRRSVAVTKSDSTELLSSRVELTTPSPIGGNGKVIEVMPRPLFKAAVLDVDADFSVAGQSQDNSNVAGGNFQTQIADLQAARTQSGGEKIQYAPVRFTLPDTIDQTLTPGGRSLSLKIQPEHLGPARLSLHYNSEGLTARVTVDSSMA